ncbi:MAG TPA: prephenate dehydrogenase/arogenate dehydrogenase family protein [Thermoanaerobaculia bacterium]|nr:prephenate dehydrogenase/arogenate dehydrogenase family protein [Thermoanaerobaculia bacterium]
MSNRVTIAGLGLIGGSIGIALRRKGWHVSYSDPNVDLAAAKGRAAADEKLDEPKGDLVIIATPVDIAVRLRVQAPLATTTCSVMLPFRQPNFVAGHPFAGSERNGLDSARGDLFEGHPWFVHRDEPRVREIIEAVGAKQTVVDCDDHDRAMALTSHLPQVISTALASLIEQKRIDPIFIGSGIRTLLRLAASRYEVWGSVLEANARNIGEAERELLRVMNSMTTADFDRARRFMAKYVAPPEQ